MRATVPSTRVSAAVKEDTASDRVLKVRLKPFLGAPLRLFVVQFAFVLIALDQTSELLPSHRGRRGTRETDEIPDGTGLRRVQGYYCSRPLPADRFEAFVRERMPATAL